MKPIILHLGDTIKYNHELYNGVFSERLDVVAMMYGNFTAIFRPHFQSGGEMGEWNEELISPLPPSVCILPSAGARYNWVDVTAFGRRGICIKMRQGYRTMQSPTRLSPTADPEIFIDTHKILATMSRNPKDRILGLVGLGSIGKKVAVKANCLSMKVHYYDIDRISEQEEQALEARFHASLEDC
ncbi:hypothetical protein BBP40_006979 [Aspergillus hancockii]|nr:hypothetical protein BBP40_006979 [Aspergillus hancockii]